MDIHWESELAQLLSRLSTTQQQLLSLLASKRDLLLRRDHEGLKELASEEESLSAELESCHRTRQELLDKADAAGLPSDSIQSLTAALPKEEGSTLEKPLQESLERSRLLRHESVAHWVAVQRTLLHLSHMLEIIATKGHGKPTYGKGSAAGSSGALIDQAV